MFWMLCAFSWLILQRLNFIRKRFGTLCLFHLHRWVGTKNDWGWECWGIYMGLHVSCYPPQPVSLLGPAPTLSPSFRLAQAIFKPNLFPYKYPNILNPSHSSYLPAYEDGTKCSETLAYNIQTLGNYPEESIQHSYYFLSFICVSLSLIFIQYKPIFLLWVCSISSQSAVLASMCTVHVITCFLLIMSELCHILLCTLIDKKCFLSQGDHNHLFIRQGTGLQGQAVFRTKLTFRPHSTESFTHRKMTLSLADRSQKTSGIKVLSQVGWDPEQNRGQMIKVSLSSAFVPSDSRCTCSVCVSVVSSFLFQ
jgi:hypothetical protein